MFTPYDWQEGIGHRAQFVANKLAHGVPVVAVSLDQGILLATFRRQTRKIYEIYDLLVFSAIGQQSDIEALRVSAVEFAHREGYNRSEQDVTIQRVVSGLSQPLKKAFADFNSSPFVARSLFAELGKTPENDQYYILDFDGDYAAVKLKCALTGSEDQRPKFQSLIEGCPVGLDSAMAHMKEQWPFEDDQNKEEIRFEAALMERSTHREARFRLLTPED